MTDLKDYSPHPPKPAPRTTSRIAKEIADNIQRGHFYAGEFSGFAERERESIERLIKELIVKIKEEILYELQN